MCSWFMVRSEEAEWVDIELRAGFFEMREVRLLGPEIPRTTWCADLAAIRLLDRLELQIADLAALLRPSKNRYAA